MTGGRSDVRERILEAAIAILRESGLRRLTQVRVAQGAGVRQSHLTYYFPTRDDLLESVTERGVAGIARAVRGAVGHGDGSAGAALLERLATSVADVEHMRMFVAMIVEADGDAAVREIMERATRRMEAELAGALGGDAAEERARLVLAAVWGLGLYRFLMRPAPGSDPGIPYISWLNAASQLEGEPGAGDTHVD